MLLQNGGSMSFSSFSKEFTANMYTSVENQFITKYLPQADGDAVRAYLYGLYLCGCKEEFDAVSCSKLLKIPYERLKEIFDFWEDCDLIRVLSREPLYIEYLPVNAAVGRPKSIKPEKYLEFNRELFKLLQKAKKDFKPYELQRILEFLENNPMEQQAFLLVAEYCAKKDGDRLSSAHILNKAEKLCRERKYTYDLVEQELADFNVREKELSKIFTLLDIYRKPQENDYEFWDKWISRGMEAGAVYACASALKKGTLSTLDALIEELAEKNIFTADAAKEYLARREELTSAVFKVARKLGVKIQNPRPYAEEYAEKWLERGYDLESLSLIATLGMKLSYGFSELDALLDRLYQSGIVDEKGVRDYCAAQDRQLRLLQKIQASCGVIRKTQSALDMLSAWQSWNFSDEMILEAAKLSANASAPLPYMNKLLSEWKRTGAFRIDEIPARTAQAGTQRNDYKSEAAIAADRRSDRERRYAARRNSAIQKAESARLQAEQDEGYRTAQTAVKKGEIALAKAEVYSPEKLETYKNALLKARADRAAALLRLGLSDEDFLPKFHCPKCSDTGFLPDGTLCDCDKID